MDSIFKANKKSSMFAGPKKPKGFKEDRALETEGSNFEKVMGFLDRPGAAERQILSNVIAKKKPFENVGKVLTGKAERLSASDVITQVRKSPPRTKAGKAAQAVAGFALDVLNPLDPLNWIGVGEVRAGAKVLAAVPKVTKFAKGLQTGERALISARLPFTKTGLALTPKFVDKSAGAFFEGLGNAAKALPGAERVTKFFKPTFNKIRQYSNKAEALAAKIGRTEETKSRSFLAQPLMRKAEKGIGELKDINPQVDQFYDKLGLNKKDRVSAEIRRIQEGPIALQSLTADAPKYFREFIEKVPTAGATTATVRSLVRQQAGTLKRLGAKKEAIGIEGRIEGFAPRPISDATVKAMERVGVPREKATRAIKDFTISQSEAVAQASKILGSEQAAVRVRSKLFGKILGNEPLKNNPNILDVFRKADPKAASFYEQDAVKAFGKEIQSSAKEISTADAVLNISKDPILARPRLADWGSTPAVKVEIPAQFQKMMASAQKAGDKVNIGHMYMEPETAHEFRNLIGIMTDTDKVNSMMGGIQAGMMMLTNMFKRYTLLAVPGTVPYMLRNFMSNGVQSMLAGAMTPHGLANAPKMTLALVGKAQLNPEQAKHLEIMKASNLFNEGFTREFFDTTKKVNPLEKTFGIGISGKANELVENFARIQHYMSRISQGWQPQAAIDDVRKYLYDYAGGLSPQLQKMKSVIPFLSWTRFNVPIMLEHILTRPGKVAVPFRAKENIEDQTGKPDERALDEFIKGDLHVRLWQNPKTGKWTYWRLKGQVPMADLEDFTSLNKFASMMMSSVTPFIKTPLENYFNKSTFFKTAGGGGAPIENYPGQTGKFLGMDLSRKNINYLRNFRPAAMLNNMIPQEGKVTLSAPDQAAKLGGLSFTPVNLENATDHARLAYKRRLSELKMSRTKQLKQRRPTTEVDELLKQLREKSYVPR